MDCTRLNQQIKELEEEYRAFSEEMENRKLRWSVNEKLRIIMKEQMNEY